MLTNTMTRKKGCGCGGGGATKGGSCGCKSCDCAGTGCSVCEAPPGAYARPQFFSGQLLTEDDLQSMIDYTVGKNRLHNRMLFGQGVACGLGVSKDPCEPLRHLVVRQGYAIDCCGNDIVVPCETTLDVVQLVRDLRARILGKDCGDPCPSPEETEAAEKAELTSIRKLLATGELVEVPSDEARPQDADYLNEVIGGVRSPALVAEPAKLRARTSYCLYVVYCEQPADPVAPYDGADTCGGGECSHTRIREGYRFELRCAMPSGCEPQHRRVEPSSGFLAGPTGRAMGVFFGLQRVNVTRKVEDRDAAIQRLKDTVANSTGVFDQSQATLISEASRLSLDPAGMARLNTIVAILLISWLRRVDCDSMLFDCPACDEDGVLLACFDFENCKISNLCVQNRTQILSSQYAAQLGLTHLWRCMRMRACCWPDKYTDVPIIESGIGVGQIAGTVDARWLVRTEGAVAAGPAAEGEANAEAAADKILEELENFLKSRVARLDDPVLPEYQSTLLPDLIRVFGSEVTRAPDDQTVAHDELRKQIADLRAELDQLKELVEPKKRK